MLTPVPPNDCTGAREAASARLDGELSELGSARLDAHLADCAECRTYAAEIAELAETLRFASLEPVTVPFFVPSRRRPRVRLQVAAAALFLAAATGGSFAIGQMLGSQESPPPATVGTTLTLASAATPDVLGTLRRLKPVRMPTTSKIIPV
jgi:predicted anti-sigma-YlaC factor YlaD